MHVEVLRSTIPGVIVTQAKLHYAGSMTIDKGLLDAANTAENEN